jgi:hypothetical protein
MALTKLQIDNLKREVPIWIDTFKAVGLNDKQISFAIPQIILESSYFTSNSYKEDLNPAGIKYRPDRPSPDTTRGRKSSEYTPAKPDYYARFKNKEATAKDYKRILSLKRKGNTYGAPIDAVDFLDYNNRLYANSYYGQPPITKKNQYYKNLVAINTTLSKVLPNYTELLKKKRYIGFLIILVPVIYFLIKKYN